MVQTRQWPEAPLDLIRYFLSALNVVIATKIVVIHPFTPNEFETFYTLMKCAF